MLKMRSIVAGCFVIWVLAACAPVQAAPQSAARQAIQATQAAMERQAELAAQAAVATQSALETQQAADQANAMIQVTSAALNMESQATQAAQAAEIQRLEITAQYLENQQIEHDAAITQIAGYATATAIVAESAERISQQRQVEVLATLIPILLCVGGFSGIGAAVYAVIQFVRAQTDRKRYIETSLGPVYLLAGGMAGMQAPLLDMPLADVDEPAQNTPRPAAWVSPSGAVVTSNRDADKYGTDEHALVLNLLQAAIQKNKPLSTQIPRFDKIGWTSNPWQRAKGILEHAGLVWSDSSGTYVDLDVYPNIGALYAAIHMGREQI